MTAKVDGMEIAAGNDKLMKHLNIPYQDCHQTGTIIHMAINGKYAGHIVISDIIKPHSKAAIAELKKASFTGYGAYTKNEGYAPKDCADG